MNERGHHFTGRTSPGARSRAGRRFVVVAGLAVIFAVTAAAQTNVVASLPPVRLPDTGLSLFRVFGALALVIGIFLGGVWLYRNWQRLALQRGRTAKLNVLETRSFGGRHALYVVAYEQERYLLAVSPTGVNLVTVLPPAAEDDSGSPAPATVSFPNALAQMLGRK